MKQMAMFKQKKYQPPPAKEWREQAIVFDWAKLVERKHPELSLLQGSLNGVKLPIGLAVKAKRQGLKRGYPDIFLPVARNGFHGLFIELKRTEGGVVSADQEKVHDRLRAEGYFVDVCKGAEHAILVIRTYLGITGGFK
ncbi:MAG: VRR-NUC domain-containing protein [Sphaerochaeta sp.]|nr:VRR-NUC domain-containing protein [Sphaerochaeta sp.]